MNLTTKISTPNNGSFEFRLSNDNYTITADQKTGNSEIDYRARLNVAAEMEDSDYTYNEDLGTYDVKKVKKWLNGYVDFHIVLTQVQGDAYIKVVSLDSLITGDEETAAMINAGIKSMKKYVGKTYKLPRSHEYQEMFQAQNAQELLLKNIQVLKSKPLFVVRSQNKKGVYSLKLHTPTLKALVGNHTWMKKIQFSYNPETKSLGLTMNKSGTKLTAALTENDGRYSVSGKIIERSRYSKGNMDFFYTTGYFALNMKTSDATMNVLWKDGKFDMSYTSEGYTPVDFTIRGTLSENLKNMNLDLSWYGKKMGNMTTSHVGNRGEYSLNFSMDYSLLALAFGMKGSYTDEYGRYTIAPPSLYEVLEENSYWD
jgi:hypothetical protein